MTVLAKVVIVDFINGEEPAFTQIYKLYYKDVRSYCYKHTRSAEIAEELASDVFLRLWEARSNIDPDKDIKPYLFTIAKNVAFTWLKRMVTDQKMKAVFKSRYLSDQDNANQDVAIAATMDLALLRQIMSKMPPKRRRTFELCKIDGLSYTEASSVLMISKETIKDHVSLARKDLDKLANATDFIYMLLPVLLSLNNLF
jgi:RNA polymerase sigma factor (sigma-70 family)